MKKPIPTLINIAPRGFSFHGQALKADNLGTVCRPPISPPQVSKPEAVKTLAVLSASVPAGGTSIDSVNQELLYCFRNCALAFDAFCAAGSSAEFSDLVFSQALSALRSRRMDDVRLLRNMGLLLHVGVVV